MIMVGFITTPINMDKGEVSAWILDFEDTWKRAGFDDAGELQTWLILRICIKKNWMVINLYPINLSGVIFLSLAMRAGTMKMSYYW